MPEAARIEASTTERAAIRRKDAFPRDALEWTDFDGDGIGDNSDPDQDNDGIANQYELP